MSESEDVFQNKESIWDYIKENPRILGVPIGGKTGLDLLSALRDIYVMMDADVEDAKNMLTMLTSVLIASAAGQGEEIVQEVLVQEAMFKFDETVKDILDEK